MTRQSLLAFLRANRFAVLATTDRSGGVQAAVVGVAVTEAFELVFDTVESSRKAANLAASPRVAFVVGGTTEGAGQTVQYQGEAERLSGAALGKYQPLYFSTFPDGVERTAWPGLIYVIVRPTWLRYSDFRTIPPTILEFDREALRVLS